MRGWVLLSCWTKACVIIDLFLVQLFIATNLLVTLPIGMILDHRNKLLKKLRRREEELRVLSRQDPLTGLLNRRGFEEEMNKVMSLAEKNKTPVSLIVMDIDYFKKYNDVYGHPQGDQIFLWLGSVLKEKAMAVVGGLLCVKEGKNLGCYCRE